MMHLSCQHDARSLTNVSGHSNKAEAPLSGLDDNLDVWLAYLNIS